MTTIFLWGDKPVVRGITVSGGIPVGALDTTRVTTKGDDLVVREVTLVGGIPVGALDTAWIKRTVTNRWCGELR